MIINNHLSVIEMVIRSNYPDYKFAVWINERDKEAPHYIVREEGPPIIVISNELPIYIACRHIVELFMSILSTIYKVEGDLNEYYNVIANDFNNRLLRSEEKMNSILEDGMKVYNRKETVLH